jgi:hypothetical protein
MPADAQVRRGPTPVFIPDVALAHVAGQDDDFLRRVKSPGLAKSHIWLACDPRGLLRHSSAEHDSQAVRSLVYLAEAEKFGAPAEPRMQRRVLAADLAFAAQGPAVEPQIGFPIELELQVVSQRIVRGVMARASEGAVADSPNVPLFDHDSEPLACFAAVFALASDEHRDTFCVLNRLW